MSAKKIRIAAIDYGRARFGIALSDELQILASWAGHVEVGKTLEESLDKLLLFLKPYLLEEIIVGNPLYLNGKISPMAQEVAIFVESLKSRVKIPVILWDERLSTLQATRSLQEIGVNRKKRAKVIDGLSAACFLQSYLDSPLRSK